MQVIIDEIVSNIRAVDGQAGLSPEVMRQVVGACLRAVQDMMSHEERTKEERSVDGPWALQPRGDR
jgi:hypothetical protein